MNLHIFVDPSYKDNLWCKQTLKGINEEATKKRYAVKMLEADDIYSADLDAFFENDQKRILIVIATSVSQSDKFHDYFNEHGVHLLYINHQNTNSSYRFSNILIDYHDSMRKIVNYLEGADKKLIALFGINPDSATDLIKKAFFEDRNRRIQPYGNGENIFYRTLGEHDYPTANCFAQFKRNLEYYDAVICANDLIAKMLIDDLEKIGVKVPEDLYIVSFGDYILAQIGKPTITAVAIDHEHLGRQAVYTYSYLCKASDDVYVEAKIAPRLSIGESTAKSEYRQKPHISVYDQCDLEYRADFFTHPEIQEIITFENMLSKCDRLDMQILIGIMTKMTYIQLSEKLFVSENVISYRVKRLCKLSNLPTKSRLIEAANKFLSAEAVERYIKKKLS